MPHGIPKVRPPQWSIDYLSPRTCWYNPQAHGDTALTFHPWVFKGIVFPRCRCFTATPTEGYPRGGEFVGRISGRDQKLEGASNTKFRQDRAVKSIIPYVLCGLYCFRWWSGDLLFGGGPCPSLYSLGGTRLHGSPSRLQVQKSYPSTFRVLFYHLRLVLLLYE
jgi:hypothetical protein